MEHKHNVIDTDPHFIIDTTNRTITDTSTDKTVIIQSDHNSERLTFEMNRYVDGHDMSTCNMVRVHYINVGSSSHRKAGMYRVTDLKLKDDDSNVVTFSWLVSNNATSIVGALTFVVQFACENAGRINYTWHTSVYDGIAVSTGINNSADITQDYADVLEAWYYELLHTGTMGVNIIADARDNAIEDIRQAATTAIARVSAEEVLEVIVDQVNDEIRDAEEEAVLNIQARADNIVQEVLALLPIAEGATF